VRALRLATDGHRGAGLCRVPATTRARWPSPWDGGSGADHHGYIDLFGNRCERITIPAALTLASAPFTARR
jgi:hypothetical protein